MKLLHAHLSTEALQEAAENASVYLGDTLHKSVLETATLDDLAMITPFGGG